MNKQSTSNKASHRLRPPNVSNRRALEKQPVRTPSRKVSKALRIVPLGGFEEVGRNMMVLEYGDDAIIIDMGLQFPEEETPGIDYIIPNITYIQENKKHIHAVLITHGHYDHIGAIPHLIGKLGNPPIYATPLTAAIIQKRQADYPNSPKLKLERIGDDAVERFGPFTVRYFPVAHNIPEGVGMEIETPVGSIVHPGEFKFDYDRNYQPVGTEPFLEIGGKKPLLLMLDSTKAEGPDTPSVPEWEVEKNIAKLLKEAEGRVIISTFASLLDRLVQIVHIGHKQGRKIALTGYSMLTNFEIAKELGFITVPKGAIISIKDIDKYDDNEVLIITTGAQGEQYSGLDRMANVSHRDVTIKKGDMVIFSSSIVPGNEKSVQILRDNLSRQGAIVYHYQMLDIHSGGHATRHELRETIKMIQPKFFLPIHGHYFMRVINAKMAQSLGIAEDHTLVGDNGQVMELTQDSFRLLDERVPTSYVMVDGLGVGDVGNIVLRDRMAMAEDGVFVIITTIDRHTGELLSSPDIISRGFVYMKESQALINQARKQIKDIVQKAGEPKDQEIDTDRLRDVLRRTIGKFLYKKTERRPMILPVVIEI